MKMTTMKVKLFVAAKKQDYFADETFAHSASTFNMADMEHCKGEYFPLSEVTVEIEVPCIEGMDFTPAEIKQLEEQKKSIQAECQAKVTVIENKIQSLLAIEHK